VKTRDLLLLALAFVVALLWTPQVPAQAPAGKGKAPAAAKAKAKQTPQSMAPIDITGTWVSVVTEDWMFRMVTPPKGQMLGVPVTAAARAAANAWDPAADEASGNACKAFGAAGVMRQPGRIRITWADPETLKIETEAGTQTRLFHFTDVAATEPTWQGNSQASWEIAQTAAGAPRRGNLKVTTSNLKPGYVRTNGVPYGPGTLLTEYYGLHSADNADDWLVATTQVHDPVNFTTDFITSTHFKKLPSNAAWTPTPCQVRQ
jgi:hypothetical protein